MVQTMPITSTVLGGAEDPPGGGCELTAPRGWRTPVVVAIIAAFLAIDALGLCITYGQLVIA